MTANGACKVCKIETMSFRYNDDGTSDDWYCEDHWPSEATFGIDDEEIKPKAQLLREKYPAANRKGRRKLDRCENKARKLF